MGPDIPLALAALAAATAMITLPALLGDVWGAILAYVFFYPVLMVDGLDDRAASPSILRFERHPHRMSRAATQNYPLIAVLVPCYNEEAHAEETIEALMELEYPNFEVVAINDGSKDRTGELLNALAARFPKLRVVHQVENQGKAVGLNTAALLTKAEILVGIDGDARLDPYSLHWLVGHFRQRPGGRCRHRQSTCAQSLDTAGTHPGGRVFLHRRVDQTCAADLSA